MCISTNYSAISRSVLIRSFSFGWSQTRVSSSKLHHWRNNFYRKMLSTRMDDIYWIIIPIVRQNNTWVGNAYFSFRLPEMGSGKEMAQSRASPPLIFPKIFIRHTKMFLFVVFYLHSVTDGSDTPKLIWKNIRGQ